MDCIESVRSGIDWITWVQPREDTDGTALEIGEQLVQEQAAAGSKVQPFSFEGYKGWRTTQVSIGSRPDGDLLKISGALADTSWTRLRSSSGHPTRLDVQTSLVFTSPLKGFGTRMLSRAASTARSHRGRPTKMTTWKDNRGSYCGLVGARTSPRYLRVYDKGVEQESHTPGVYWRVELEAKQYLARELWKELRSQTDAARWCYACCERSWTSAGCSWRLPASGEVAAMPAAPSRVPPDVAASLEWMRTTVRGSVTRLRRAGHEIEVLRALGFADIAAQLESRESEP